MDPAVSSAGQDVIALRTVTGHVPSPRQITWTLLNGPRPTDGKTKAWIEAFRQRVPDIQWAVQLAGKFIALLREKQGDELPHWLSQAAKSPLASFAAGLRRDWAAVKAACSSPWSQGQVEGQINRLKMLKRQMYGRASFALLRRRMLFSGEESRPAHSLAA